ncbi:lantibiotic dehydratase [Brevibacillus sp. MCWH]|jgi:hypothetical protein|uniref:lantibiotic dehydratase n=1 Tax=Brevibacillus sp. MCWH TaxID=2508871 RepID=UPI0014923A87|nr:lantibiotic dehydratase [Brevibacillus sp. MCWH]NNV01735.1 hypothetical protein [Brevibacillus sp. MCWH]
MSGEWKLANDFILRSTGFAFSDIERLRFSRTVQAIEDLFEKEEQLNRVLSSFREHGSDWLRDRDVALRWKRLKKSIGKMQAITAEELEWIRQHGGPAETAADWNQKLDALHAAKAAAVRVFEAELQEKRRELRALVSNPRFQEAVFLSSPHMYRKGLLAYLHASGEERNAETKRLERQLVAYLQRMVGKNETTSFFGPINYGCFADDCAPHDPDVSLKRPDIRYNWTPALQHRETFMAYWAVQTLAETFSRLPSVFTRLRPVRSFLYRLRDDGTIQNALTQKRSKLPSADYELLHLADGTRTVEQMMREVEMSEEQLRERLFGLEQQKLINLAWEVPITATRTLEWLMHEMQCVQTDDPEVDTWRQSVRRLLELKNKYSDGDVAAKEQMLGEANRIFQELTGQATERSGGRMYADRTLFYEECRGQLAHLRMSVETRRQWEQRLRPVLQIAAKHAVELKQLHRTFALKVFRELYGETDRMIPFIRFLTDAMRHEKWEQWTREFAALQSSFAEKFGERVRQLAEQSGERVVVLDPDEIAALVGEEAPDVEDPLFCSPDLMVIPGGEAVADQLILGEIHDTVLLWGWALSFHPEEEQVRERMWQELAAIVRRPMANMLGSKRLKIIPFEFPGYTIQMRARSVSDRHDKKGIAELYVSPDGELQLILAEEQEAIRLYNGELHSMAHEWFAIPRVVPFRVDLGDWTPRIVLGDVVYQRERWKVTRDDRWRKTYAGTSFELFYDMLKLRRELKMPEYVYVRVSTEPKPFLIDFHNYFLLEMWESFMREDQVAIVTEMLPGPEHLWLRDTEGNRYCAEFRTSVFYHADAVGDQE